MLRQSTLILYAVLLATVVAILLAVVDRQVHVGRERVRPAQEPEPRVVQIQGVCQHQVRDVAGVLVALDARETEHLDQTVGLGGHGALHS